MNRETNSIEQGNRDETTISHLQARYMNHFTWVKEKPDFTEECILVIAQWYERISQWEYTLFEIKKLDNGVDGWYWGICCSDGEEWGDIGDLKADLYFTMPLLNSGKNDAVSDTTGGEQGTKS